LVPAANNKVESILAAIVLKAGQALTVVAKDSNPDQSVTIEESNSIIIRRNEVNYRQYQKTINFERLDSDTEPNPADM
jgi:hypothetical protein